MFLLENVKGLRSQDKGKTLTTILEHLDQLGYQVHWKVLNSLHYGVPQSRERWYCVGFKKDVTFNFPEYTNKKATIRDIIDWDINNSSSLKLSEFEMSRIKHHFKSCSDRKSTRLNSSHVANSYAVFGLKTKIKP